MWPVRAYTLKGNPIYPKQFSQTIKAMPPIGGIGTRPPTPVLYAQYPWIIHFKGRKAFESPSSNPAGIFLVLFWPVWLLLRRRRAQPEERACLYFIAIYLAYWGYIWGVLRYAIVPIILLFVFTTARLVSFHDRSETWLRATIRLSSVYALVFAMLVTMILEVNAPQLSLFAKQLDSDGYLRESLITFRSLEYVQSNCEPSARILSVNNLSNAYAPPLDRFRSIHIRKGRFSRNPDQETRTVRNELQSASYSCLVLPRSDMGEHLRRALRDHWTLTLAHRDEHFAVYRIRPLPEPPTP